MSLLGAEATPREADANPYGNPFNDYLRAPYGVRPQDQASLPPVQDNPDEPFDWYRHPRAAIGVYGGPSRSIITPEGYLQNAFGALTFATGASRTPVNQRVKTWKDGYLPILSEQFGAGGVQHAIQFFAAKVPGVAQVPFTQKYGNVPGPRGDVEPGKTVTADVDNMVNFVNVRLTNPGSTTVTHRFSATLDLGKGMGPINGNAGPAKPANPGWDSDRRVYGGEGKLLLVAGQKPSGVDGARQDYDMTLAPHETRTLTFALPYFVGQQSDANPIKGADYDRYEQQTAAFWHKTLDEAGTTLRIPGSGVEKKVLDTYKANLAFCLILMNVIDGKYYWNANPTVYNSFYLRDTAFIVDGILNAGLTDVAKQVTLEMLDWQRPSGQFISYVDQNDGNGQALWAFANYFERTHDTDFARQVWPAVKKAMDWEWQIRKDHWDSDGGLFPKSLMDDNEGVRGHVLTYDLWNIAGEEGAAKIAAAVGEAETAKEWTERRTQYVQILRSKLEPQVNKLGLIPPAVEGLDAEAIRPGWYGNMYGIDWGNLEAAWPTGAFAPDDPWMTKSLAAWRKKMFEGVFGYPWHGEESTLHSYTPISLAVTDVMRGDQEAALSSLYSLLTHTSATHMTSEGMSAAQRWDWTENGETQPHAEFSGKYMTLLRNMLVYEGSDASLHLANVWSPQWSKPGETLGFDGNTDFGPMSYSATVDDKGATMRLNPPDTSSPKSIVISSPAGTELTSVTVNGQQTGQISGNKVTLPALGKASEIRMDWRTVQRGPDFSVARAVSDYKANYRKMTSPPKAEVTDVRADQDSIEAGQPLTVSATVRNSGGAGYLADRRVVLYVDGTPAMTDDTTFTRGIGFTTPPEVDTFGHHDEGTVPVGFTPQLCSPGRHTLGIGLGSAAPTQTTTVEVRTPNAPCGPIKGLADKCLDVKNGVSADGTQIQLYGCNNTPAQSWTRSGQALKALGKCLTTDGAQVQLRTCDGTGAQNWVPQANRSLVNPNSGKCLDVERGQSADGTRAILFTCHGGDNQKWSLPA